MRVLLLAVLSLLLLSTTQKEEERIAWNEDHRLSWADFKGQPKVGNSFVASTNSGLSFGYGFKTINGVPTSDFNYEVTSYFYPESSWYIPEKVNERVLSHEQTHFDITELYARKLRKRIAEFDFTTKVKDELDALYSQIERERRQMQSRYDLETNHSINVAEEAAWVARVQELLKKYEPWKE